jgi:hypothetical protein
MERFFHLVRLNQPWRSSISAAVSTGFHLSVTINRFAFHLMRCIIQKAFNLVRLCQTKRFAHSETASTGTFLNDCGFINQSAFHLIRLCQPEHLTFFLLTYTPFRCVPDKPTEIMYSSWPVPLLAGNLHIHIQVPIVNTCARFPLNYLH